MKTIRSFTVIAALFGAAFVQAGPPPQFFDGIRRQQEFQQLKAGDKVLFVCNECRTVSELVIAKQGDAMTLCKENGSVSCPACKIEVKVSFRGPPARPELQRDIVYTNPAGKECVFIAQPRKNR